MTEFFRSYLTWSASGTWIQGPRGGTRQLLEVPEEHNLASWSQHVLQGLLDLEWQREPLDVGVPSAMCLIVPRQSRQRSLASPLYELEDQLPIAAENWVTVTADDLIVLYPRATLRQFRDALHDQGVAVRGFVPDWLYREPLLATVRDGVVVVRREQRWELAAIRHGRLHSWSSPGTRDQLLSEIRWLQATTGQAGKLVVKGAENDELSSLQLALEPELLTLEVATAVDTESRTPATAGIQQRSQLVIRSSQLSDGSEWSEWESTLVASCQRMILAAVICLLVISWWGYRLREQRAAADRELGAMFSETFPGQEVPAAAAARLQSERQRLRALRTTTTAVQRPQSALPTLARWLESFPEAPRFRVTSAQLDERSLSLSGEAPGHTAVGALVQALATQEFEATSPSSQQRAADLVVFQLKTALRPAGSQGAK